MVSEAKQTNYIQVNNLLVDVSKVCCPECRKKIVELVVLTEDNKLKNDQKQTKNSRKEPENPEIIDIET
jgi:hypothetical protein